MTVAPRFLLERFGQLCDVLTHPTAETGPLSDLADRVALWLNPVAPSKAGSGRGVCLQMPGGFRVDTRFV